MLQAINTQLSSFSPRDLAQTCWALGELRYRGPLVPLIVSAALTQAQKFTPSEACAIAQSLAFMGLSDSPLYEALGPCLLVPHAGPPHPSHSPHSPRTPAAAGVPSPEYWEGSMPAKDLDLQVREVWTGV